jgi:hypothetical protein
VGATLQYSTNGDNGFVNSTGNSFMLTNNAIYETNAIQIRQIDAFGNVSDISKNASRIVVDSAGPIFEQQSTVAPTSKLLIVITPLLVMPSLFNKPVSSKVNVG